MELEKFTSSSAFLSMFRYVILLYCMSSILQPARTFAKAAGNDTDRSALLKFKETISNDPYGVLGSWNDSVQFCNWPAIACSKRHQRITAVNLEGYNVRGTISPYIGNLSFLRFINLGSNSFFGEIPPQVGRLFRLQHLNLSFNMLEGTIPINLSYCSQLKTLSLGTNKLTGAIPLHIGSLMKLVHLNLQKNNLTGGIPPPVGNISSLQVFSIAHNNLVGSFPDELGQLKRLSFFAMGSNNLYGPIPFSMYNISSMSVFSISNNQFTGTFPPNLGLALPNLLEFYVGLNKFTGLVPESFSNASLLQALDISNNDFFGQVPASLGSLSSLWRLGLTGNSLGSYLPNSLDFITSLTNCSQLQRLDLSYNRFGGVLPNSISNLSTTLLRLYLGGNQISGTVPSTLENLVNLILLAFEDNLFTGVIPTSLGKLQSLQVLALNINKLTGKIPSSIGNLTRLFVLNLLNNKLEGSIPPSIKDCKSLQYLDISKNSLSGAIPKEIFGLPSLSIYLNLSQNSLIGNLPLEVGKLKNINIALDLSENNLTGEIPKAIGDLQSLESLYLQGNFFQGTLPYTLASLRGLLYLDFSRNNLTGKISKDLLKLHLLLYLNLSFNNLEGEVPTEGIFQNTSAVSIVGNTKLCGGVPKLQLKACPREEFGHKNASGLKLKIIIACAATIVILFLAFFILYWRWKSTMKLSVSHTTVMFFPKVTYKKLHQATNGFSPSKLIGKGSFGSVYTGLFDVDENLVAIKVLNLQRNGANKSFLAECNALRNIRHQNLVKVITCCSSLDYSGNEFKALVFEYMPNGSLEKWLHLVTDGENRCGGLDLIQRLNIASDVASAIYYLHEDCEQPIIHCDLKPSNVLLDNEMVAHVSDFGLARLISNPTGFSNGKTSTIGIKGTIGYAAPEYAMGGEPSKLGDIYSYGILVLEMFTGRRPTDELFKDDFNLHNFVKMALPKGLLKVVDHALLCREVEETTPSDNNKSGIEIDVEEGIITFENPNQTSTHLQKCLLSMLQIGLACSEESPNERMNMRNVVRELQHIKNAYVGVETQGHR